MGIVANILNTVGAGCKAIGLNTIGAFFERMAEAAGGGTRRVEAARREGPGGGAGAGAAIGDRVVTAADEKKFDEVDGELDAVEKELDAVKEELDGLDLEAEAKAAAAKAKDAADAHDAAVEAMRAAHETGDAGAAAAAARSLDKLKREADTAAYDADVAATAADDKARTTTLNDLSSVDAIKAKIQANPDAIYQVKITDVRQLAALEQAVVDLGDDYFTGEIELDLAGIAHNDEDRFATSEKISQWEGILSGKPYPKLAAKVRVLDLGAVSNIGAGSPDKNKVNLSAYSALKEFKATQGFKLSNPHLPGIERTLLVVPSDDDDNDVLIG